MPQLTPEYDRVLICGFEPKGVGNYDVLNSIKIKLMMQEIRISEDYCHSDILIFDFGNFTLEYAAKVTLTHLKKYELCYMVSALLIRNLLIDLPIGKVTPLQARLWPKWDRNIALLPQNLGVGRVVSSTPRQLFTPGKDTVPIVRKVPIFQCWDCMSLCNLFVQYYLDFC
jgi:hypothetical protein